MSDRLTWHICMVLEKNTCVSNILCLDQLRQFTYRTCCQFVVTRHVSHVDYWYLLSIADSVVRSGSIVQSRCSLSGVWAEGRFRQGFYGTPSTRINSIQHGTSFTANRTCPAVAVTARSNRAYRVSYRTNFSGFFSKTNNSV